jgi:hypothetical protein
MRRIAHALGSPWRAAAPALLALLTALPGCIPIGSTGRSLGVERSDAYAVLRDMGNRRKPLKRPVVILNGYHTPAVHTESMRWRLANATSGDTTDFLMLAYPFGSDIRDIAADVVTEIEARWPGTTEETAEVDVIGVSMGGIVAAWASLPQEMRSVIDDQAPTQRLKIRHLFTFATPHRGARMAEVIALDSAASQLKSGSLLLSLIEAHERDYELVCYAHHRDFTVGSDRTAPPGTAAFISDGTLLFSHHSVVENPVFLADVARRLRDEPPLLRRAPKQP